jgi:hypothetical protein
MTERKAPKTKHELDPESEAWKAIPWRKLEQHVFRIQKRIYRASQQGKTRTVQKLQKLLMKSEAARLLAVRRVTQDNQGKKTAGVDGVKSVQPAQRFVMTQQVHPNQWKRHQTRPVRRVWIAYVDTSFTHKTIGTVASWQQAATTRPLTSSIQPCGAIREGERYTGVLCRPTLAFALRV